MGRRLVVTYKNPSSPGFEISEVCGEDGVPRHVCQVLGCYFKKNDENAVQCSGFLPKLRKLRTCKLGRVVGSNGHNTRPELYVRQQNGTGGTVSVK